ncbi:MAG: hypothetical protein MR868_13525 [Lachnospiraceae bacterium]|nr:hypothetical protein [Lachnospiraceae bacterium]
MLTAIGFLMLLVIVLLLLSGKVSLPPIFVVIPVLACLICGFALGDINKFIGTGLSSVLNTVALFTFAVLYFSILNDVGMFDVIVSKLMRFLGNKVELVMWITCLVATISHLDGSGATTMLVTIPMMLPIYKKMKIRPQALLLLAAICSGSMNMTPWCSSVLRLTSATATDAMELWRYVLPLQVVCLVLSYLVVIPLAKIERKNGAGMTNEEFNALKATLDQPVETKVSMTIIIFDIVLTLILLIAMLTGVVKSNLGFMMGLAIALVVNFPNPKEQTKKVKEFGGTALNMIMIIFSIGVLVGVLKDSGMMDGMVQTILAVIPESLGSHLTWIVSALSVPLSMFLGSDTVYMAVAPIMANVVTAFGSSVMQLNAAFLIGACLSANLCLVGPTPYLALGLADVDMPSNLKYCFPWVFGISLIVSVLAGIMGVIPF